MILNSRSADAVWSKYLRGRMTREEFRKIVSKANFHEEEYIMEELLNHDMEERQEVDWDDELGDDIVVWPDGRTLTFANTRRE